MLKSYLMGFVIAKLSDQARSEDELNCLIANAGVIETTVDGFHRSRVRTAT